MKTDAFDRQAGDEIIASFNARPEMLVQILHGFMERFGWITDDAIRQLATELNLPLAEVHGVVSYYHDFRTEQPGKHIVKICAAEACQSMGSRQLEQHAANTLADQDITVEPVYCLGNCACSPAIMVDGKTYGRVSSDRLDEIVQSLGEAR